MQLTNARQGPLCEGSRVEVGQSQVGQSRVSNSIFDAAVGMAELCCPISVLFLQENCSFLLR